MRVSGQQKIPKHIMKLRGGSVPSMRQPAGGLGTPVSGSPALEPWPRLAPSAQPRWWCPAELRASCPVFTSQSVFSKGTECVSFCLRAVWHAWHVVTRSQLGGCGGHQAEARPGPFL